VIATALGWMSQALALVWGAAAVLVVIGVAIPLGSLWGLGFGLALAGVAFLAFRIGARARRHGGVAGAGAMILLTAGLLVIAVTLYQDVGVKARLAADQGTVVALRSAAAIYYGKHRTWPSQATLATLVPAFDGRWQCPRAVWTYDQATGAVTYTPNDLSACR